MKLVFGRHPADDVLMDLVDGTGERDAREHVAACDACRSKVEAAAEGLHLSRGVEIPEPPALYWEAFRRQVGRQIESVGSGPVSPPLRWWPAVAAAVLVVGLFVSRTPRPDPASLVVPAPVAAWSALPPAEDDEGMGVLSALETADLGSTAECQDAADCVAGLSDDESQALTDALRNQMRGGVS